MSEHELMLSDLEGLDIDDFDAAEYIGDEQAVAAYLTEALEANDASLFAAAVGNVARARGMTEIARASGLAREGLYKALRPNSQPRMETITRVLGALGVRLVAEVIPIAERKGALASLPVVLVPERSTRQAHTPVVLASGEGRTATRTVAPKPAAKSIGKPTENSAVAKAAAKRPAAKSATKHAAAKPAAAKPASAKPA